MELIGLTGGIGSGKSTVAGIFTTLGIPVYESDARGKFLMNNDVTIRKRIIELLGPEAYVGEKQLNSSWIATQVFSDRQKLDMLNAIVHPAVYADLVAWAAEADQQKAPYLIQESAILFEENLTERLSAVILVVADQEARISRVKDRDHFTREQVLNRIEHQWKDEMKLPLSDYVIFNDTGRSLIAQVMDIDMMIKSRITNG